MSERRWARRPPNSNWGQFGDADQRGRMNLLTPDRVRAAAAEIREGLTFCLSLPLDYPGGNYHDLRRNPPRLHPVTKNGTCCYNLRPSQTLTDVWCDDYVELYTHGSTHWDGLGHVGMAFDADGDGVDEIVYYNGYRAHEDIVGPVFKCEEQRFSAPQEAQVGARALGMENMAVSCVQGRGVMIDLYRRYGRQRAFVGYDDLMRILEQDRVEIEEGDMVCLHTGLAAALLKLDRNPDIDTLENSHAVLDSRDRRLLRWVEECGLAAIAADNFAVEGVPARPDAEARSAEPLHELCIVKLGVHLGELWFLTELNDWLTSRGRTRFMLTAPPLRLPGAVGSPVTPIATV